jgi:ketosteroid isomerase-like protein
MTAGQNIETARQMYQAFGRGDVQAIPDRVTDDVDWSTDAAIASAPWYVFQVKTRNRASCPDKRLINDADRRPDMLSRRPPSSKVTGDDSGPRMTP